MLTLSTSIYTLLLIIIIKSYFMYIQYIVRQGLAVENILHIRLYSFAHYLNQARFNSSSQYITLLKNAEYSG